MRHPNRVGVGAEPFNHSGNCLLGMSLTYSPGQLTSERRLTCYTLPLQAEALDCYARTLGLSRTQKALHALTTAIAASPRFAAMANLILVARPEPQPVLAAIGHLDPAAEASLQRMLRALPGLYARLRYVDYRQAERDSERLAMQLTERFGPAMLRQFHFTAIPRGGQIVLGMLAYVLGLRQDQLLPPEDPEAVLVAVDDCAISGFRFSRFLESCRQRWIIFATLYSPPSLRAAIEAEEPRVIACLSAHDKPEHPEPATADSPALNRQGWRSKLPGKRYWLGSTDIVCFAWSEPDYPLWNPVTEQIETGWRLLPPELCLKNRELGREPLPVQVQPTGKGPLKPSGQVIFGEFQGDLAVGNLDTGECFRLEGVAADFWRALVATGDLESSLGVLLPDYEVDETTLRADLRNFLNELRARGLLE